MFFYVRYPPHSRSGAGRAYLHLRAWSDLPGLHPPAKLPKPKPSNYQGQQERGVYPTRRRSSQTSSSLSSTPPLPRPFALLVELLAWALTPFLFLRLLPPAPESLAFTFSTLRFPLMNWRRISPVAQSSENLLRYGSFSLACFAPRQLIILGSRPALILTARKRLANRTVGCSLYVMSKSMPAV